ncbi:MAG: ubiquinone/menaquinone biosynthesis methyltransferase [Anaerolineae bacterium]
MRALFSRISSRYDLVNRILSLGQDRRWRRQALALAQIPPGGRLLDVATGTGDVALMAKKSRPDSRVIGVDLTAAMVRQATTKDERSTVGWSVADGLALPFPDDRFDGVISAFMMRNVPDVAQALAEQRRVVRSGGRVVCLEMTWPRRFPMAQLFHAYFFGWAPLVGWLFTGDMEAYQYLPGSVRNFMGPEAMEREMAEVGLREIFRRMMMLGTVGLYVGVK